MKSETRNPKQIVRAWGSWLIILLLLGHLIFCHGCHGEDVDDELCVPPPPKKPKLEIRKPDPVFGFRVSDFFRISDFEFRIF